MIPDYFFGAGYLIFSTSVVLGRLTVSLIGTNCPLPESLPTSLVTVFAMLLVLQLATLLTELLR